MIRPTGVTVLAILAFIGTAFMVLVAIGAFVGGAFIGTMLGASAHQAGAGAAGAGFGAVIGAAIGVGFLIGAALYAACGYGLWNVKEWGRMLTIILSAIGVVFGALSLLLAMTHLHIFAMFFTLVRIGIGVLIIWYLSQPQVKAAFMPPVPQAYPAR